MGYPWSTGDVLLANDLNAAIASAGKGAKGDPGAPGKLRFANVCGGCPEAARSTDSQSVRPDVMLPRARSRNTRITNPCYELPLRNSYSDP
jgi:hypothetical protein